MTAPSPSINTTDMTERDHAHLLNEFAVRVWQRLHRQNLITPSDLRRYEKKLDGPFVAYLKGQTSFPHMLNTTCHIFDNALPDELAKRGFTLFGKYKTIAEASYVRIKRFQPSKKHDIIIREIAHQLEQDKDLLGIDLPIASGPRRSDGGQFASNGLQKQMGNRAFKSAASLRAPGTERPKHSVQKAPKTPTIVHAPAVPHAVVNGTIARPVVQNKKPCTSVPPSHSRPPRRKKQGKGGIPGRLHTTEARISPCSTSHVFSMAPEKRIPQIESICSKNNITSPPVSSLPRARDRAKSPQDSSNFKGKEPGRRARTADDREQQLSEDLCVVSKLIDIEEEEEYNFIDSQKTVGNNANCDSEITEEIILSEKVLERKMENIATKYCVAIEHQQAVSSFISHAISDRLKNILEDAARLHREIRDNTVEQPGSSLRFTSEVDRSHVSAGNKRRKRTHHGSYSSNMNEAENGADRNSISLRTILAVMKGDPKMAGSSLLYKWCSRING